MTGAGHVMMSGDAVDTVDVVSKDVMGTANFDFHPYCNYTLVHILRVYQPDR